MKRFLIGALTSIILVTMAAPVFANPASAPPTNKVGPEASAFAKDPANRPFGQLVSEEAQTKILVDEIHTLMGLTPPGNTP